MAGFGGGQSADNMVSGSIQISDGVHYLMIDAFVPNPETTRIQNRFAVQNNSVVQTAALGQTDRLEIVNLVFFAESATGRDFLFEYFRRNLSGERLMADNPGRKFNVKIDNKAFGRTQENGVTVLSANDTSF